MPVKNLNVQKIQRGVTGSCGLRGRRRLLESPLLHAGEQGGGFDAEEFGCAICAFDFPIRLFEGEQKIVAFPALHFGFGEESQLRSIAGRRDR